MALHAKALDPRNSSQYSLVCAHPCDFQIVDQMSRIEVSWKVSGARGLLTCFVSLRLPQRASEAPCREAGLAGS